MAPADIQRLLSNVQSVVFSAGPNYEDLNIVLLAQSFIDHQSTYLPDATVVFRKELIEKKLNLIYDKLCRFQFIPVDHWFHWVERTITNKN